jgi:hypothetical protein
VAKSECFTLNRFFLRYIIYLFMLLWQSILKICIVVLSFSLKTVSGLICSSRILLIIAPIKSYYHQVIYKCLNVDFP